MSGHEVLEALYHWSPADRRRAIQRDGLKPYSQPVVHSGELAGPYLSLGFTPSGAWGLSGDMGWVTEVERWDLWQVRVPDGAEVHVRPEFGPVLREVRLYSAVAPADVWLVATREPAVFEDAA